MVASSKVQDRKAAFIPSIKTIIEMDKKNKIKIEFGDFQTPRPLAEKICQHLNSMGVQPDILIEPTCGVGVFLRVGAENFGSLKKVFGFDINKSYVDALTKDLSGIPNFPDNYIEHIDFFKKDWNGFIGGCLLLATCLGLQTLAWE